MEKFLNESFITHIVSIYLLDGCIGMSKELDDSDFKVLDKIYQKMRANRKPYIDKATLHFQHSNESCEKLRAAHLLFFYKGNDCVGLTDEGIAIAVSRRARNNKL